MLAKAAALELKPQGIRVNCVSPAAVMTPMWQNMPFWRELVVTHGSEQGAWKSLGGIDPATAIDSADGISGGDCECDSDP